VSTETVRAIRPPSYPARPINGGHLELAPPKAGQWHYEPKYNGWRALVHAPTGLMFNRYAQPLSIAAEFGSTLKALRETVLVANGSTIEWFDCEALDRRHALGRGTLLVFDFIAPEMTGEPWLKRKELLAQVLVEHDYQQVPLPGIVYGVGAYDPVQINPHELYRQLRQLNIGWGCQFYEGLLAKRITDAYPRQLRSPHQEFVGWVKHRLAGFR